MSDSLEDLWADLLSEEPPRIVAAWAPLKGEEKAAVRSHLTLMATEAGWTDGQRQAAQRALDTIGRDPTQTGSG